MENQNKVQQLHDRLVGMELYKARKEIHDLGLEIRVLMKNGRDLINNYTSYEDPSRVNVSVIDKGKNIPLDQVSDNAFIFRVLSIG